VTVQDVIKDWAASHPLEYRLYKAESERYGSGKAFLRWLPLIARWME
jgi:hypothetical protein